MRVGDVVQVFTDRHPGRLGRVESIGNKYVYVRMPLRQSPLRVQREDIKHARRPDEQGREPLPVGKERASVYVYYSQGHKLHGDEHCGQMRGGNGTVQVLTPDPPQHMLCHFCGNRARRLGFIERLNL